MWKRIVGAAMVAGGIAYAQPPAQGNEVPLAAIDIARGETANLAPDIGSLRTVRLKALRGAAYIDFIEMKFDDGSVQHVDVNKQLAREETADIDLNGKRGVAAITIRGTPDVGARIQVIGLR